MSNIQTTKDLNPREVEFRYRVLTDLWISENHTKTSKLQILALVNSIFFTGFILSDEFWGKFVAACIGLIFSFFWLLSIANTVFHQKVWQKQIAQLEGNAHINVFSSLDRSGFPFIARVPAPYFIIGTPLFALIAWALAIIFLSIWG